MATTHPLPEGFAAAATICSVKKSNTTKPDLGLLVAATACPARAIYTQSQLVGAHVHLCREHLARSGGLVKAIFVNSGNANCATGEQGVADARTLAEAVGKLVACPPEQVLVLSTGVIGARLPMDRILPALPVLAGKLAKGKFQDFTRAIMTTDTFPKLASQEGKADDGSTFHVAGTAKGAGMIHPDMATMLGFLVTDARTPKDLHYLLRDVAEQTFHRVTIDGDTSPNDTLVLWSSERHWVRPSQTAAGAEADPLRAALVATGRELARMIARDGEGATRRVTVIVRGAPSEKAASTVGRTIATSPLVKTAIHGRDPNWGRILAAAGRSGIVFDANAARVWIGPATLYADGAPRPENEAAAHAHMKEHEDVEIGIDLACGPFAAECWTCDYSAEYVSINADYRS